MGHERARRATAYLLVLITVMITVAIGASSVMVHRVRRERLAQLSDTERARAVAQAGLELAAAYIQSDLSWRTNRGLGVWMQDESVLDGVVTLDAWDADGNATDDATDAVTLTSEGVVGRARQILSVTLNPVPVPMDCLLYSSSAVDQTGFQGTLSSNATVAANGSMAALLAAVRPNVIAGGSITGLTYQGTRTANAGTRQHPGATALDWYIAKGTAVPFASIPSGRISNVVVGPNRNPWGTANANGIYVINCGGANISIRDCRIEGTLVLLNAGSSSKIDKSVNWKPADPSLPSLLVQGSMEIDLDAAVLSEAAIRVNFNPASVPYNGVADSDQSDTYASRIEGLVYTTADLTIKGTTTILGQVVCGDDALYQGTVTITRSSGYYDAPPRGFVSRYNMLVEAGSLARVLDE